MSSLQALQQEMLQAVLTDTTPRLRELRGDERANATTRLDIYRHGYRIRLREALAVEYPGLSLMAGKRFSALLENYVEAHPSGHYNIRWHGAGLAAFLDYGLPWREKPELADMARLDWAISTVFDASDEPTLAVSDVAAVPPSAWGELVLEPQPHLQILSTPYNVEAFRRAADQELMRPRLRRYSKMRHLLIWRQELTVRYRSMDGDELAVLTDAIAGKPFAALCESLAQHHGEDEAMSRMATLLHGWVDSGLLRSCNYPGV
jgi:hypothetical protein